ncbi:hypothetical protein ES332_A12G145000v1 [Gossypium tomentosum]|uniref:Uncharacterized protein n=1 Tax=Gossypium tomentosum TaxID=34277 RepID=A0A5D2MXY1_GOSTO|nr:hypothetical protein ES332_A12G145000v1 [Gossypium tomentosum]
MAEEAAVASTPPQSSAPPLGSTVIPSQKETWNCTGTKLASGSVDQTARVWHIEPHGHDYEYASYNPVAFDIANHFCEMAAHYTQIHPMLWIIVNIQDNQITGPWIAQGVLLQSRELSQDPISKRAKKRRMKTYVIFLAKLKKPQFSPRPESSECCLFELDDIPFDSLAFSSIFVTLNLV